MFKIGDTVKCVTAGNHAYINVDQQFTVVGTTGNTIGIHNNYGDVFYYPNCHFTLVEWVPNPGDEVEIQVNTKEWKAERYFIGFTRDGLPVYEDKSKWVYVVNPNRMRQPKSTKTIPIDGIDVEISRESFDQLKEFFQNL